MTDSNSPLNAVRDLIEAINNGDSEACLAAMSDDVVIIDDVAPFRVSGQEAAQGWLGRVKDTRTRLQTSLTLDDADVRIAQDQAYVVAPGHLKGSATAGEFHVDGLLASTLEKRDGQWLVNSLVWSSQR
jgi:ketosteroid isomerase-like protein